MRRFSLISAKQIHHAPFQFISKSLYCTTIPVSTTTSASSQSPHKNTLAPNLSLQSIKEAGISDLELITQQSLLQSRKSLIQTSSTTTSISTNLVTKPEGPSIRQLRKAKLLHDLLLEQLDKLSRTETTFTLLGESIDITNVEISPDLRQARVYWTLPSTMMDKPEHVIRMATKYMHQILAEQNGSKLKHPIGQKLRNARHVPKLKFIVENPLLTHTDVVIRNIPEHLRY